MFKLVAGSATAFGLSDVVNGTRQETTDRQTTTESTTDAAEWTGLYVAALTGQHEPNPVDATSLGAAIFCLSKGGQVLDFTLWVHNLVAVTQAHIHLGTPDETGSPVVWLYPDQWASERQLNRSRSDGELETGPLLGRHLIGPLAGEGIESLVEAIEAGRAYVNVHTENNRNGEIRGQIAPVDDLCGLVETATQTTEAGTTSETTTETKTTSEPSSGTTTEQGNTTAQRGSTTVEPTSETTEKTTSEPKTTRGSTTARTGSTTSTENATTSGPPTESSTAGDSTTQ